MAADFQDLRTKMVDNQIRTTDVTDLAVIDAFLAVPREAFVPTVRQAVAYIDEDQRLETEASAPRYLMEPSPFAKLVQLAGEIREALCNVVADRSAHFASNLGVVELCVARMHCRARSRHGSREAR